MNSLNWIFLSSCVKQIHTTEFLFSGVHFVLAQYVFSDVDGDWGRVQTYIGTAWKSTAPSLGPGAYPQYLFTDQNVSVASIMENSTEDWHQMTGLICDLVYLSWINKKNAHFLDNLFVHLLVFWHHLMHVNHLSNIYNIGTKLTHATR